LEARCPRLFQKSDPALRRQSACRGGDLVAVETGTTGVSYWTCAGCGLAILPLGIAPGAPCPGCRRPHPYRTPAHRSAAGTGEPGLDRLLAALRDHLRRFPGSRSSELFDVPAPPSGRAA
jgi:hypothetical protein